MLASARSIYLATRKRHDLIFNHYFMRPVAAVAVAIFAKTPITPNQLTFFSLIFHLASIVVLIACPSYGGALIAIGLLEVGYMFDCADGMLARHRGIASVEGHLFDFFTDELKALVLIAGLGLFGWRTGATVPFVDWGDGGAGWLLATIVAVLVLASATSLTNFVRRPELTGVETPVEAHYESVEHKKSKSLVGRVAQRAMTFLQFLNHYPSHIWIFALLGALDVFFWIYLLINGLYLAKGWLGLVLRFGRG